MKRNYVIITTDSNGDHDVLIICIVGDNQPDAYELKEEANRLLRKYNAEDDCDDSREHFILQGLKEYYQIEEPLGPYTTVELDS